MAAVNKSIFLAALVCYAALLFITAPASLLNLAVRHFSNDRVSLANMQGTIWQGRAVPVLHPAENATYPLHTLAWKIKPQAWLAGQFKVALSRDESEAPMELCIDRNGLTFKNLIISLPAEILGDLSPFLKPAWLGGNLRIESPRLVYANGQMQGEATAHWNQASSAMSAINPLGDYLIDILAANGEIHATLSTQSGTLLLNGQGSWSPAKHFKFNGTARGAGQSNFNELLHHLGPETAPGIYQISL